MNASLTEACLTVVIRYASGPYSKLFVTPLVSLANVSVMYKKVEHYTFGKLTKDVT